MSDALATTSLTPLTVRASSMPAYQQCARRSAAIILFRELADDFGLRSTRRHIGAVVGSGTHGGVAYLMREFQISGVLSDRGALTASEDMAVEIVRAEASRGFQEDSITPSINDAEHQVRGMVKSYQQHADPSATPVLIERGLQMSIGPRLRVTGHLDRVDALAVVNGQPRDLKTGRRLPQAFAQYGAYYLLLRANVERVKALKDLQISGEFIEEYMPRVKRGKEQPPPSMRAFKQGALEHEALATAKRMERDFTAFRETGDPDSFPNNPTSWLCSAKFCPAWGSRWCSAWMLKPQANED